MEKYDLAIILIALPWQQWLLGHVEILYYTYIASLLNYILVYCKLKIFCTSRPRWFIRRCCAVWWL